MAFPSTLSTFNQVSPTDRLNSPSHSALHNAVSSAIGQVEAVIGVEGASSVVGTLEYFIKSPDSDGGGHIQTANKGGTGQTSYTKGDLLVATSSSVLAKLAVGASGQTLVASVGAASGMIWANPNGSRVNVNASVFNIQENAVVGEVSVMSVTIPGSTLGTNNAVRATAFINISNVFSSVVARARFGNNLVASVMLRNISASIAGTMTATLMANNNVALQRGILQVNLAPNHLVGAGVTSVIGLYNMNTSSVESSANQTLGLTLMGADTQIAVNGVIVEKIV